MADFNVGITGTST